MKRTVSILIEGKVQGVFYRQSTREKALALGVSGEVRNQEDGTVSVVATGEINAIDNLVNWCKTGPPKARVSRIIVEERPLQSFDGFRIAR